jgi:hypothetical protein
MAKPWKLARHFALRSSRVVLGVCAVLPLGLGGCRAVDNAQVDVLERELRQQEDYIYELEDYLIEYSEKLHYCRSCQPGMTIDSTSTPTTKRGGGKEPTLARDPPQSTAPRRPNGARVVPPIEDPLTPADAFEAPPLEAPALPAAKAPASAPVTPIPAPSTTTPIDPAELEAPGLEIGPTSNYDSKEAAPIATTPPGDEAPPYIPDPADYQLDAETSASAADTVAESQVDGPVALALEAPQLVAPETTISDSSAQPTLPPPSDPARLVAERLQIRGVLRDRPESDGAPSRSLMVIVEALNATDEPVDANGEASLMVSRGETPESLQPIERWDFTSDETQAAWQSSQLGDGLHLELPLAGALPDESVYLWVRLKTPDGQKLQAKVQFSARELATLEAALAASNVQAADSLTQTPPLGAPETVATADVVAGQATDSATGAASVVASAPVEGTATPSASDTQWRASNEPLNAGPVVAIASTVGGATSGGWTTQAPGRMPVTPTPRVATASDSPRWQQGSGEAPASESPRAWTPFR